MIEKCIECGGTGVINSHPCDACDGKGKVKVESPLEKFIGTYRVKAHYDLNTNDFPRNTFGNIDPSFGDFYIPCKNNCEIKDAGSHKLMAYIPTLMRGRNIVKNIIATYGEDIIFNIEETSEEVIFFFKTADMENIAKIMKPITAGAKIKPLSIKNLPKTPYQIPEVDMGKYSAIMDNFPKREVTLQGRKMNIVDGLLVKRITKEFDAVIQKTKGKKYNVESERKLMGLGNKEFIHKLKLWDEYLSFLSEKVKEYK